MYLSEFWSWAVVIFCGIATLAIFVRFLFTDRKRKPRDAWQIIRWFEEKYPPGAPPLAMLLLLALTASAAAQDLDFPAGTHTIEAITSTAPERLTIKGAGRGKTIVRFTASPGITIESTPNHMHNWASFDGITFEGDPTQTAVGFRWASRARFRDCEFRGFGQAIDGRQVWDSSFDGCSFTLCGTKELPVVFLGMLDDSKRITSSNNIIFSNCHFEPNRGICVYLGKHTTKCRLIGIKCHGELPAPHPVDFIRIDQAYSNTIGLSTFANGGGAAISLVDARGNIIQGNQIAKCAAGVRLLRSSKNIVTGNSFAVVDDPNGTNIMLDTRPIAIEQPAKVSGNVITGNVGK